MGLAGVIRNAWTANCRQRQFGRMMRTAPGLAGLYERAKAEWPGDFVVEEIRQEGQAHPLPYIHFECEFASRTIHAHAPTTILDVGSYRQWLLGLLAKQAVTTVDVRSRPPSLETETILTCDVQQLPESAGPFDMVTSLSSIEHFGLGRYGDPLDFEGDRKALARLIARLKTGGHLVLSVPITQGRPQIRFNLHRIYGYEQILAMLSGMVLTEERYVKRKPARWCDRQELCTQPGEFDVYCGCFKKK